jgi:dTDP-4-dehydrorhamnose reductase
MRLVVTGREGQVVRSLLERAVGRDIEVVALGRPELELAGPEDRIIAAVEAARPDVLVSAAAYTQVDKAESEPELAFAINDAGPRALAKAARRMGVPLIHPSTDYVFDGSKPSPYTEEDSTGPASVYGSSKLAGEQAMLAEHGNSAILRTAWVYSPFGGNFVKTMLRLAVQRDELRIVADQRGNPTCALDIADGILAVAANLRDSDDRRYRGIFHMTAAGEASWAEFAAAIFAESRRLGGPSAIVTPIATADYPTPATRPANSRLESSKLERVHKVRLPEWRSSLKQVVERLVQPMRSVAE